MFCCSECIVERIIFVCLWKKIVWFRDWTKSEEEEQSYAGIENETDLINNEDNVIELNDDDIECSEDKDKCDSEVDDEENELDVDDIISQNQITDHYLDN